MNELPTSKPYGYLQGEAGLKQEINQRKLSGEPLLGEGIVLYGGKIVHGKDGSTNLEVDDGQVVRYEVRVFPSGAYRMFCDSGEVFSESPPDRWQEVTNP